MDSTVSISPDVVREVARITTLATPGVLALVDKPGAPARASRDAFRGVEVAVRDNRAHVRLRLIAAANISLLELGQKLQTDVASAVAELVGMDVTAVDVTFEDVRNPA
jgi:uncharacterized alkaline shock family protein YloU